MTLIRLFLRTKSGLIRVPMLRTDPSDETENSGVVLMRLRRMLDASDFASDGRLPTERELVEHLGVGRRAVRRALEVLEAEGLLWRRQGKGTFIGQPPDTAGALAAHIAGEATVLEVMIARICIEPALARLCAARANSDDVAQMRDLAQRTHTTGDPDAAELWDGALHRLIARTAGNRVLLAGFALIDELRTTDEWRVLRQKARGPETLDLYRVQHDQIIDSIEAGDGDGADMAMQLHLKTLMRRVEGTIAGDRRDVA